MAMLAMIPVFMTACKAVNAGEPVGLPTNALPLSSMHKPIGGHPVVMLACPVSFPVLAISVTPSVTLQDRNKLSNSNTTANECHVEILFAKGFFFVILSL